MRNPLISNGKKTASVELEEMAGELARMGGLVEDMLEKSVRSVVGIDHDMARAVIARDADVDRLQNLVDGRVEALLEQQRLSSPDLRQAIAAMRVAADLERIGDLSKNIAKRALVFDIGDSSADRVQDLSRMGRLTYAQLKRVLDAFSAKDDDAAELVWERDEEVDEHYNSLFRVLLTYMMEDPRTIGTCTHLLFMAKNLERIGDHCTNIAETIHYLVTGDKLTAERPKADDLSS